MRRRGEEFELTSDRHPESGLALHAFGFRVTVKKGSVIEICPDFSKTLKISRKGAKVLKRVVGYIEVTDANTCVTY